ncbi:hypothetical protein [Neobacillus drentensis]|uniref:hypothetical protein n=1 Tax=Neobacillus drentensis TaxID=220684 RepID=UPI003001343C
MKGRTRSLLKPSAANGLTDASAPVKVIYDKTKSELSIDKPVNNLKTNREAVTVEGTVSDQNLDWVKVNGQKVENNKGKYSHRVLLSEGENTIQVIAQDKAGNILKKSVVVDAKFTAPFVENLQTAEGIILKSGKSFKIEFDSEAGLKTVFAIRMPFTNTVNQLANATEFLMMETSPGIM